MNLKPKRLKLLILIQIAVLGNLSLLGAASVNSYAKPRIAPTISYVSRTMTSLSIQFVPSSTDPTARYQYTLDNGKSWKFGTQSGNSILVSDVDPAQRYQIAIREINQFGAGLKSKTYSTRLVLVIGASITAGSGGNGNGWVVQVATKLGWQLANLANSGTGFNKPKTDTQKCQGQKNFISQINCGMVFEPEIVIVSGGLNDCRDKTNLPNETRNKALFTYGYLRMKLPNAILIGTPVITFDSNNCLKSLNDITARMASASAMYYVAGADSWLVGRKSWTSDGVHPNQIGHANVAKNFINWLRSKKIQ